DVEAEALDARDGRAARALRVGDDLAGVVDHVGRVDAETERDRLLRFAEIGGREAAELEARARAIEADGARAVDEPELERAAGVEDPREPAVRLRTERAVAEDLEEGRAVVRVRVRERARRHVRLEPLQDLHREREAPADVIGAVRPDLLRRIARVAARELRRTEEPRRHVLGREADAELARGAALRVLGVDEADAAGERRGLVHL